MKHAKKLIVLGGFLALGIAPLGACSDSAEIMSGTTASRGVQMEVLKNPSCGCCGKWVEHVQDAGFDVSVSNRQNLDAAKAKFGIAPRYQSCHTGVVGEYVFEGHIPAAIIQKFLDERPVDAIGLAVPGMPVGSPGMEMGDRIDSYDVLLLKEDGGSDVYAHIEAGGAVRRDPS